MADTNPPLDLDALLADAAKVRELDGVRQNHQGDVYERYEAAFDIATLAPRLADGVRALAAELAARDARIAALEAGLRPFVEHHIGEAAHPDTGRWRRAAELLALLERSDGNGK